MNQFTKYLSDCTKNDKFMTDPEKLETIFLEIQAVRYPIGLEGYGFFTVTYKFLGSVSTFNKLIKFPTKYLRKSGLH